MLAQETGYFLAWVEFPFHSLLPESLFSVHGLVRVCSSSSGSVLITSVRGCQYGWITMV